MFQFIQTPTHTRALSLDCSRHWLILWECYHTKMYRFSKPEHVCSISQSCRCSSEQAAQHDSAHRDVSLVMCSRTPENHCIPCALDILFLRPWTDSKRHYMYLQGTTTFAFGSRASFLWIICFRLLCSRPFICAVHKSTCAKGYECVSLTLFMSASRISWYKKTLVIVHRKSVWAHTFSIDKLA